MPQFESEFEQSLYRQRQEKLEGLKQIGQRLGLSELESIYPNRFPAQNEGLTLTQIPHLLELYDKIPAEQLDAAKPEFAIAGRLMSHRLQGKAGFAHLQQGGKRLQIYVRKDDVGSDPETADAVFTLYKLLDLGDHIGVRGTLMRTRTGELTLKALPLGGKPAISFLAKAMLALPDKYHGLEDVELRYRQRYVDLIMNSGTLAKAEVPAVPSAALNTTDVSSRPEAQSAGAERPAVPPEAPSTSLGIVPGAVPGTSAVTDSAAPNEQHNDAPLNVREVFIKRAQILRAIRKFLDARGFLEVETPMLHTVAGGAAAKPFKTHHNALDIPLSLRIAPELFLKRLVVGGLDRVYEINRNFRNEGVSTRHNPEFTMLEFYQAYANYEDLMELTQELIQFVAMEVNGTTETWFNGTEIDLSKWQKLSMREAIVKFWPEQLLEVRPVLDDFDSADRFAQMLSQTWDYAQRKQAADDEAYGTPAILRMKATQVHFGGLASDSQTAAALLRSAYEVRHISFPLPAIEATAKVPGLLGKAIAQLFELLGENVFAKHLIQPTIIYDFPLAVSPLSKVKPDEPDWVERFEFYIGGFEVGNAFSELNDPEDQRRRFADQLEQKERGDEEAMAAMDEDYVRALGYGLPPTAGEGIGIDRLTMLLTGSRSIRDVILFPLMRPRAEAAVTAEASGSITAGEPAK